MVLYQIIISAHRSECSDTSGTFIELPALKNLKTHHGNDRKTIEKKMTEKVKNGLRFA